MSTEEKTAAEKLAQEQNAAFELGMHAFLKKAGIESAEDAQAFFAIAAQVAHQE